ncbi:MAG: DUF6122 family protein [Pseudomonadales bacterium]
MLHAALHLLIPAGLAGVLWPARWLQATLVLLSGLLIDVDHLLADPVYDPGRCSLGFHPLHTALPIAAYALLGAFPRTRLLGIGLLIHILLDAVDCRVNTGLWYAP